MKMTELQFAGMTINLSTLGQVDLSDNDPELLVQLAQLLSQAERNVAIALAAQRAERAQGTLHVGARVVVTVAGDMFTGQHATIRDVKEYPRLKRIAYTLDIDGQARKYGAGPYKASDLVPEELDAARYEQEHGEPPF